MRDWNENRGVFEDEEARGAAGALGRCPLCGAPLFDGERVFWGHGTDAVLGCEHCVDTHFAVWDAGGAE